MSYSILCILHVELKLMVILHGIIGGVGIFVVDTQLYHGATSYNPCVILAQILMEHACKIYTVFHQINVLGAEAKNEPLSLSDFNDTDSVS